LEKITQNKPGERLGMPERSGNDINLFRFSHYAMATTYEIFIGHTDGIYSGQAAQAAFSLIDSLEQDLSRFIENSDISRINRLNANQSLIVGPETMACLLESQTVWRLTGGAFDPGAGVRIARAKSGSRMGAQTGGAGSIADLRFDPAHFQVHKQDPETDLDLGGIGKGFALDKMDELLREWSIGEFLLHSGQSTVMIRCGEGGTGWKISLSNPEDGTILGLLDLRSGALSASGMKKGDHIIDPRNGQKADVKRSTWVRTESAALADALSTAFMLMSVDEISDLIRLNPEIKSLLLIGGEIFDFGLLA
jgi:thiamine biosynthesis lipoprotein